MKTRIRILFITLIALVGSIRAASLPVSFDTTTHMLAAPLDLWTVNSASIFNALSLSGMSYQSPSAVSITGGTIQGATLAGPLVGVSVSSGCMIGDSTTAAYVGQQSIGTFLLSSANSLVGSTVQVNAVPGHTINQQKAVWEADPNRSNYDWIFIMIGLNDVGYTETDAAVLARYQALVNSVNASKKASARVFLGTMTPAKARYTFLFGGSNGATAYTQWLNMNAAVMGSGANAITNVDGRISWHTDFLNDGAGNLASIYDTGDQIHETDSARRIIAAAFGSVLQKYGFFRRSEWPVYNEGYTRVGSDITFNAARVGIGAAPVNPLDVVFGSTGAVVARVKNSAAGTGNYGQAQVSSDTTTTYISSLSSTWPTSGPNYQAGSAISGDGSGGLSLAAMHASGAVRLFSGGTTLRATLHPSGGLSIGSTTDPGAANLLTSAGRVVAKIGDTSTAITLSSAHHFVTLNNASTVTVNLPAAASNSGREYWIKNLGAGSVTIDPNSTEQIRDATVDASTLTLTAGGTCHIVCDGTRWERF